MDQQGDAWRRWLDLYRARNQPGASQEHLGPLEHGAFSQSLVAQNPLWSVPLLFATPVYSAAKSMGLLQTRSPASVDEMAEGYRGIGRGLLGYL